MSEMQALTESVPGSIFKNIKGFTEQKLYSVYANIKR